MRAPWEPRRIGDGVVFNLGGSSGAASQPAQQVVSTTQKSDPWSGQQPFLLGGQSTSFGGSPGVVNGVFPEAAKLYDKPLQYFPGSTVAPTTPQTQASIGMETSRALNGSPINAAMQGNLVDTLKGNYLDPASDPGYQTMVDRTIASVRPGIDSSFEGAGRYGGGLAARAQGQGVTDAVGAMNSTNYQNERQRQLQSMLFAPTAANQDYYDIAQLGDAGSVQQQLDQQQLNDQISRFNFGQQEPWQRLGQYNQLIQGNYGGSTTGTQSSQVAPPSVGANALGFGLGGAGILGLLSGAGKNFGLWGGGG